METITKNYIQLKCRVVVLVPKDNMDKITPSPKFRGHWGREDRKKKKSELKDQGFHCKVESLRDDRSYNHKVSSS